MDGGPRLAWRWVGVPRLLGWYPLCVGSVLVLCLRRCLSTAPTVGLILMFAGMIITLLCNNVTFCLVQPISYHYLYFGETNKAKWARYYIVIIFILSW